MSVGEQSLVSLHSNIFHPVLRQLQENDVTLSAHTLMYPIFLVEDDDAVQEIASMPGVCRYGIYKLKEHLEPLVAKKLSSILLFGVPEKLPKDYRASAADHEKNPVIRAIPLLRKWFPSLLIACDVCMCPYTDHGHCGFINESLGGIDNELSIKRIAEIALAYAKAGAHIVAPSDMMDNRIHAIKKALKENNLLSSVNVLSYSAKFASSFYGPFRDALLIQFLYFIDWSYSLATIMPPVPAPESAIKRAAFKQQQTENFKKAIAANKAAKSSLKQLAYKRGLKYSREYRGAEKKLVTLRRQAATHGNFYLESKPKIAVVTRIRGIAKVAPKQRKILQLLRLRQIFNTVFVKLNKPMENMLRAVEPYITYGYPSLRTVRAMVYKRGFLKVNGQRIKINDNQMIKDKFNNEAIVCAEDLVHEIYTCGKNFRTVTNGFWPFKLAPPAGGMRQKRRHFVEGGDFGNRETLVNRFLARMI